MKYFLFGKTRVEYCLRLSFSENYGTQNRERGVKIRIKTPITNVEIEDDIFFPVNVISFFVKYFVTKN